MRIGVNGSWMYQIHEPLIFLVYHVAFLDILYPSPLQTTIYSIFHPYNIHFIRQSSIRISDYLLFPFA